MAFQIVDDLLDVQGDETKLGKRVGKDSELGKWTYPRFLGVDGSRRRARQLADEAVAALAATRPSRRPPARPGAGSFGKGSLMEHADSVLARIESPADLKELSEHELEQLAAEMRTELIGVVGRRSAHFASNLGVVELCLALHLTFDFTQDRLIWDTGHQIYPHKLITGRAAELHTIRTKGGPDGLPQPGREPLRPVHDRPRRLRPVDGAGAEGRRRDRRPAAIGTPWPSSATAPCPRASSSRRSTTPAV